MYLEFLSAIHAFQMCESLERNFRCTSDELQESCSVRLIEGAQCSPEPLHLFWEKQITFHETIYYGLFENKSQALDFRHTCLIKTQQMAHGAFDQVANVATTKFHKTSETPVQTAAVQERAISHLLRTNATKLIESDLFVHLNITNLK